MKGMKAMKAMKAKKVKVKSEFNSLLVDLTLLTGSTPVHPLDDVPGQLNTVLIKTGFLGWSLVLRLFCAPL